MKKPVFIMIVAVCVMAFYSCRQAEHPGGIEHVVVIGLDGLSTGGLMVAQTPCMDSLAAHGAYNSSVRCVLPTVSTPNWNAMLCGAGPEVTGAIDNSWKANDLNFPYPVMSKDRSFPNIFRIIREQKPDAELGAVYHWGGFRDMLEDALLNKSETHPSQLETAQKSAEYILNKKPTFLFIQLDGIDGVGHNSGHMSPDYIKYIEETDAHVRLIVDAIRDAGIADKTVIMLTSDHGGIFHAHGGNTYEEIGTPFIFCGKGVKKNYRIKQQMYRYDLAADVAFALGVKAPQVWTGRPTKPAYIGFDEPDNLWSGADVLPSPTLITKKISDIGIYGGFWVDEPAILTIGLHPGTQGDVRYTLDGTEPTTTSPLYTTPVTLDKPAVVKTKVYGETGESLIVSGQYRIADTKTGNGLRFTLYHCPHAKSIPPTFGSLKPVAQGTCYEFGFHTPENIGAMPLNKAVVSFKDHIAVTFEGWIEIDADNEYNFELWSTGGSKLFIGDELIVNNRDNGHSGNDGRIELKKGRHPVRIEFFHNDGATGSILHATYEAPGMPKRTIPAEKLFLHK